MRTAIGAKAIGAVQKFRFPDGLQDQTQPVLDQTILEARYPQRSVATIPFGNVDPAHRFRPITHPAYTLRQFPYPPFHSFSIVLLSHPIDSRRLSPVLTLEAFA